MTAFHKMVAPVVADVECRGSGKGLLDVGIRLLHYSETSPWLTLIGRSLKDLAFFI